MKVDVATKSGAGRVISSAIVKRAAEAMLRELALPKAELSVLLCRDEEIHELNRDFRQKDKPTDVLAFALREGEDGHLAGDHLGDVVISVDTAKRQAAERKYPVKSEVFMLLAHGLLHLLGWDHQTDDEDAKMRQETERLVSRAQRGDRKRHTVARTRRLFGGEIVITLLHASRDADTKRPQMTRNAQGIHASD